MAAAEGAAKEETSEAKKEEEKAEVPRERIGDERYIGLVVEWRGYMGWIQPLSKIEHEKATKHKGRIYLNVKDVSNSGSGRGSRVKEGSIVDFKVYADHDGLGAEECQCQTVLRMTLKHSEVKELQGAAWSEYLSDSEYYPDFLTEHKVLLRKYKWSLPFSILELWGSSEAITKAAVHLACAGKDDAQDCELRLLLPERAIAKVEALPDGKVSPHAVVTTPARCRSLTLSGSREKCVEAAEAFLKATGAPAAAGA